jgi:hypothetical protein
MTEILKTKTYNVSHAKGYFKILISEHYSGVYYGGILRDERPVNGNQESGSTMHIKQQKFMGDSEENIYNLCIEWLQSNLGKDYQISFGNSL